MISYPAVGNLCLVACLIVNLAIPCGYSQTTPPEDRSQIERIWKSGDTLPAELAARFPIPALQVPNDTGINVLVDLAHQCAFATLWGLPRNLHKQGFRSCVSHASLDTVLEPGKLSRVRVPVGKADDGKPLRPFGWVPNPRFNVVISFQSNPEAQSYLPEERAALVDFVTHGGGLIVIDNGLGNRGKTQLQKWADQSLATSVGVDIAATLAGTTENLLGSSWTVTDRDPDGSFIVAQRELGQGRVVLLSSLKHIDFKREAPAREVTDKTTRLKEIVTWAAGASDPVGGAARFSQTHGGGGGIYPELEERLAGVVVYYARNQKQDILKVVRQELPKITQKLYTWFPSPIPEEPMFILLAAGSGGGWAVNAFYPKETGTISLDTTSLLGIFAHELGHTMSGPRNSLGTTAGHWFDGNQGEAHAGWWQGKILALYSDDPSMRQCNDLFKFDTDAAQIDLGLPDRGAYKQWGNGKVWKKLWWIWQTLDDNYGTTWYPRWRWVQYTRWQDNPQRRLTVEETIEDMSIACGEDLFPFFKTLGTSLQRSRLGPITFQGQTLELRAAELKVKPAGPARHEPIGDYTQPILLPD